MAGGRGAWPVLLRQAGALVQRGDNLRPALGRYLALGMKNQEKQSYDFDYKASASDYTPAALRQAGVS